MQIDDAMKIVHQNWPRAKGGGADQLRAALVTVLAELDRLRDEVNRANEPQEPAAADPCVACRATGMTMACRDHDKCCPHYKGPEGTPCR